MEEIRRELPWDEFLVKHQFGNPQVTTGNPFEDLKQKEVENSIARSHSSVKTKSCKSKDIKGNNLSSNDVRLKKGTLVKPQVFVPMRRMPKIILKGECVPSQSCPIVSKVHAQGEALQESSFHSIKGSNHEHKPSSLDEVHSHTKDQFFF